MADPTTQQGWIDSADARTTKRQGFAFPPTTSIELQLLVEAAWESFGYLQKLRRSKSHRGNMALACAEHYAYARVVVCAGGALVYPFIISGSLGYQTAKALLAEFDLLQEFGQLVSQGNSQTTPASKQQLSAAIAGAEAGLELHYC